MVQKKILVVDDEPNIVKLIEVRLISAGYDVVTADNGEEGLKKTVSESPDLILLDVTMPGMDGFEVLHKLKTDPKTMHIPVLMLTAMGATQSMLKAQKMRAADYILKPFKGDELLRYIKRYVL
ncbi:MAG: response regulator [Candidatus Omnitrophica bacterium]|nr:response regulator [Candidatus Omnitrophota bacterium]